MKERVRVPVRQVGKDKWGHLSAVYSGSHYICGEEAKKVNHNYSFVGQHRVRLYRFKKNVHWKLPSGVELEISSVPAANPPRRHIR